jgi:predicted amidophosphoribosyltransferase
MQVNLKRLHGNFNAGYALDKHTLSSTPIGHNEQGHMQFDTKRPPAGEALYQLKYNNKDFGQVEPLAQAVVEHIVPLLPKIAMVVPMPPSRARPQQPVTELARAIARKLNVKMFELLRKAPNGPSLKDLPTRAEKVAALQGMITLNPGITNEGRWTALLVDDLFDSGATVDAACHVLRTYEKIGDIYVATITWK